MQFVDGKDLFALVQTNGPFSVSKAVNCILQAARGLEFAHAKGVIHREIVWDDPSKAVPLPQPARPSSPQASPAWPGLGTKAAGEEGAKKTP